MMAVGYDSNGKTNLQAVGMVPESASLEEVGLGSCFPFSLKDYITDR